MKLADASLPRRRDAALCTDGIANWSAQWLGLLVSLVCLVSTYHVGVTATSDREFIASLLFSVANTFYFLCGLLVHTVESRARRCFFYRLDRATLFLLMGCGATAIYLRHMVPFLGLAPMGALIIAICCAAWFAFYEGFPLRSRFSTYLFYLGVACFVIRAEPMLSMTISPTAYLALAGGATAYLIGTLFFMRRNRPSHRLAWTICVIVSVALLAQDIFNLA